MILSSVQAQKTDTILNKVREKLQQVKDYQAEASMQINVPFLQVPDSKVSVYFKHPDKFRIIQTKGVSIIPRGGLNMNLHSLLDPKENMAIDAGIAVADKETLNVVKLLPTKEEGDVVLSTLYIDEKNFLVKRIITATKQNGMYTIDLIYGKYISWALPDELIFSFDTKDYKLPKGMTFDYDDDIKPDTTKTKSGKGEVKILFQKYIINKGLSDAYFQQK
jgi:outer membrane lipoprotein-sorting protein